jgi:hypothetical protein
MGGRMSRFIFDRSKEKGPKPLKVQCYYYAPTYFIVSSSVPEILLGKAWKLVSKEITSSMLCAGTSK